MHEITMPRLSDSMEAGTIVSWLMRDGEAITSGTELVEIETDKATVGVQAEADGVLEIVAPVGATVAVGEPIARVVPVGPNASPTGGNGAVVHEAAAPTDDASRTADGVPTVGSPAGVSMTDSRSPEGAALDGLLATPLARRLAQESGVALAAVTGSGPRGRITKRDVAAAAGIELPPAPQQLATPRSPRLSTAPSNPPASALSLAQPKQTRDETSDRRGPSTVQVPTRVQALIARRMTQAKATIPHFEVQTEVVMDEVLRLRSQLREQRDEGTSVPSINDIIVKACGLALRRHTRVNASFDDGDFLLHSRVNIGVAVATEDSLVVPTVFDADCKSLGTIAAETRELAARVRDSRITPSELSGGTFTVSNLGMYGMTAIGPVINAPQAAILGVGAIRETLARVGGEIVDRSMMTLTLTCDHRILYGADASTFLAEVQDLLQRPLRLAL
jgi:pyruvate dehydrogenase E2 component (dihydrolipoamide acetyltransferase)